MRIAYIAMDIDGFPEKDERISEIFYFFEALTSLSSGRTVGRKIGVVQEVMLRWYLEQNEELKRRMYLEQLLHGASGASHKVEFSWYAITPYEGLAAGDGIPGTQGLTIISADPTTERIRVGGPWHGKAIWLTAERPSPRAGPLRAHLDEHYIDVRLLEVTDAGAKVDVVDRKRLLASLESKRVGAQRFSGSQKLGSGIQTIEKAKQASLVAIDLDIQYNGTVKPLQGGKQKQLISLVALGNGVHWTPKDKAVLGNYVDYTFFVKDAGIIRYAEFVRSMAADDEEFLPFFMSYFKGMTKQEPDGFQVSDDDFAIIVPEEETRPLIQVLREHVLSTNP